MFSILIVCRGNWDTLAEMPYVLKKGGGDKVDVYCSDQSWLICNSYYDTWYKSALEDQDFVQQLIELVNRNHYDWVIVGDEPAVELLNRTIKSDDDFLKIMPLTKLEWRSVLSSKIGLARFCESNSIAAPGYQIYNQESDGEKIKSNLKFPVVPKIDFSWGGEGMVVWDTPDAFDKAIPTIPVNKNILIQEYIIGKEHPVEALFFKGKLLMYQTSEITKYSGNKFSITTQRNFFDCPDIKERLVQLGEKLGLNGFVSIAYIFDSRDGSYNLIEVDTRPNSWTAAGRFLSPDLLNAIRHITGKNYSEPLAQEGIKASKKNVALFYKDLRRTYWDKDLKTAARWVFNINGYWRYIPFYDFTLFRKATSSIVKEIYTVYKDKYFSKKVQKSA
ncbi:MAG: ATP-grasp domain-containing protein [Niabella sp.]|nr:ATP-grasp domain-containing protein [Niabella sp.]